MTRKGVLDAWYDFSARFEGVVPWMYLDVIGLVTTGVGNLIDPMPAATSLPWRRTDGSIATWAEVADEWQRVKRDPNAARLGHRYAQRITSLRLSPDDVRALVLRKLEENDRALRGRFGPAWDGWPADAQMATHSMAWACGPGFRFPRLDSACRARDWDAAAAECTISTAGNPGVAPRNVANRILYHNAARAPEPELLYWPRDLASEPPVELQDGPVEPAIHPPLYLGRPGEEPPPEGDGAA